MSNGDIGHVQEVVGEIFLDDIALVAAADHEVVDAVRRVDLHDVPEDRLAADLDHRLGLQIALFGNASAKPAGQNDDFQSQPPPYDPDFQKAVPPVYDFIPEVEIRARPIG